MSDEILQPEDPGEELDAEIQSPEEIKSDEDKTAEELLKYEQETTEASEISILIQLFKKSMESEDTALASTAAQMRFVLHSIAQGIFDILGSMMEHSSCWPKREVEEFLAKNEVEPTNKGLSKAAQQHLMVFWSEFLPRFKKVILAELDVREADKCYPGDEEKEEKDQQTLEEILQDLEKQKRMTEEAAQRADEQERNANYMITVQRQLTQELHAAKQQLHEENPVFNGTVEGYDRAQDELKSYQKKEKDYEESCHQMKSDLNTAQLRCSQLEEGERIHLKRITEMEGRHHQLLDEIKKLEEQLSWQMVGGRKEKTFAAAASPSQASPGISPVHKEPEKSKEEARMTESSVQGPSRKFMAGDFSSDGGIFSTFWVKDFSALISNTSLEISKGYIKKIQELKDKMYLDVKEAFSSQWELIEPKSHNLLPQASMEEKTVAFRQILKELCIARTPNDLYTRLQQLKKSPNLEPAIAINNYFMLPGLIPGRKDFVHVYNTTLESSNRATVQMLLALHLPQLWKHVALLEHFNDNMAKKTNFVYFPRKEASEFEVALHLVCLFVAEELFAFERHVQKRGYNQTAERPMVPDAILFDHDYIHKICDIKKTTNNVKEIFLAKNPCSAFYSLYKTEKQKFRTLVNTKVNPTAMNKKTESTKRKTEDDGHLFD